MLEGLSTILNPYGAAVSMSAAEGRRDEDAFLYAFDAY